MEYTVKDILRLEVAPALGCTEPTAVALGAASAAALLPLKKIQSYNDHNSTDKHYKFEDRNYTPADFNNIIDSIEIWLDPNIFKNGLAVAIPGTGGLSGLALASAIGAIAGDPMLRMEVLVPITDADVKNALEFVRTGKVKINLLSEHRGLYIKTLIKSGSNSSVSIIEVLHDNITSLEFNENQILDHPLFFNKTKKHSDIPADNSAGNLLLNNINSNIYEQNNKPKNAAELEKSLRELTINEMISLADQLDHDDFDFIELGIEMNMELAVHGLENECGLRVGATLKKLADKGLVKEDMIHTARVLTAAAGDARMSGVKLPAMSSAGSGNHGLTAIIPIKAAAGYINAERDNLCKAVGLSHIVTACIKAHTGRLAAICACSVAAGAGAAAGIAHLFNGTVEQIGAAIENIIEDLAGVICDGAKNSCALKLDTAAGAAVQAALFAVNGLNVKMTDGIVGETPEKTIRNIGILSSKGMVETDRVILQIMIDKILK